jgi:hypothetical protein
MEARRAAFKEYFANAISRAAGSVKADEHPILIEE